MDQNTKKAGLYIHVPFCSKKCNYCDFYSFSASESLKKDYVEAIVSQARFSADYYRNTYFDTVFIGGGTPTSLGNKLLCELIRGVKQHLNIEPSAEFTVETNPGLLDASDFEMLASLGVNRLSIGLQSANTDELELLGRIHDTAAFTSTVMSARSAGITDINGDIMFSLPFQTMQKLDKTLDFILNSELSHISAYSLKIEDGTPFSKMRDSFVLPDEDTDADMYLHITDTLKNAGFKHYEISNFAISGKECKHNLKYWDCKEYVGLGPAAHSYFNGTRYAYSRDLFKYIEFFKREHDTERFNILACGKELLCELTEIDKFEHDREKIILGLRLSRGVSDFELAQIGNIDTIYKNIRSLINCGLIIKTDNGIALTADGMYVSNTIINMILRS